MLAHHSPFLQTSLRGAAPHYHPQKPHSVNRKKPTSTPGLDAFLYQSSERRARAWRRLISSALFFSHSSPSPLLIFISLFLLISEKGEGRGTRGVNESGTLACDNCHAEWTSPLFIGFWNSIHCLGRKVIKGVEIQTLLSCQLSERNFFPSTRCLSLLWGMLVVYASLNPNNGGWKLHSFSWLFGPGYATYCSAASLCVVFTFSGNTQLRVFALVS